VTDDGDALGVDARSTFQKEQAREGIVEMVVGYQHVVQVLTSVFPFGGLLALENILHEGGLICGKTLPTPAKIEESVSVFEKE